MFLAPDDVEGGTARDVLLIFRGASGRPPLATPVPLPGATSFTLDQQLKRRGFSRLPGSMQSPNFKG